SSLSIRYNQFYKVLSPENLIIGVSNTKNFDNLETTMNDQDVSKTKNDNSSNIKCTHTEVDKLNNSKNNLKSFANIEVYDQKTFEIKEDYKEFEILYLNTDCKLLAELWEGITNLNNKLHKCGDFDFSVKEVPYSCQNKTKILGQLPNLNTNLK
ncbi:20857_t:CDS:2, partial [Gigaspora margarita]